MAQRFRRAGTLFTGAVLFLAASPAFSQSCALCYTQAASAGARFIQALRGGILVLIIPPMFMSVGITVLAYRKRNQFHQPDSQGDEDTREGDAASDDDPPCNPKSATDSDASCNMERQISQPPLPGDKWQSRN